MEDIIGEEGRKRLQIYEELNSALGLLYDVAKVQAKDNEELLSLVENSYDMLYEQIKSHTGGYAAHDNKRLQKCLDSIVDEFNVKDKVRTVNDFYCYSRYDCTPEEPHEMILLHDFTPLCPTCGYWVRWRHGDKTCECSNCHQKLVIAEKDFKKLDIDN